MSSAQKGAQRCGAIITQFSKLGYRVGRMSASGQRRGKRIAEKMIAGDLIAWAPQDSGWPHFVIEVGGIGKRVAAAFDELEADPLPVGFLALVARCVNRRWCFYLHGGTSKLNSLAEVLEIITGRAA